MNKILVALCAALLTFAASAQSAAPAAPKKSAQHATVKHAAKKKPTSNVKKVAHKSTKAHPVAKAKPHSASNKKA